MNLIFKNNELDNLSSNLRGKNPQRGGRLARKILTPTLMIIASMIAVFYAYSFLSAREENQARELEDSQQAEKIFNSEIKRLGDFAIGLAIDSAENPEIQKAFAERDRTRLMELTLNNYLALDEAFNIPQYQFHLPPATSFLRLHSPEKFGDDLSSFRYTVLQVNDAKQPVVGLEVGRGGLGLRGIEPVFFEGRHIGSVEFGLNIDQTLVNNLKNEYGYDWRIVLTREALSLATLEDIAALQEGPSADLLVLASTIEGVFPEPQLYNQALNGERGIAQVSGAQSHSYSVTVIPLRDYSGKVIGTADVISDRTTVVEGQRNRLVFIFLAGLVALALSALSLVYSTNLSLRPLEKLTEAADAIQKGDLNQQVNIPDRDEIGELAKSFNLMITRLRETLHSLDRRASDLSTVAEVSIAASTVLETDKLLQQVVDLAKERFGLYHAHIYLLNEAGDTLLLASGAGEPGRQMVAKGHSIPLDREQSLVARAARERKGVTVNDVTQAPDFLPNPLLPDTRSELAVPMIVGGRVIGVFDVQSEQVERFTDADIDIQTTLASQVAVSIQNTRQYVESMRFKLGIENSGDAVFATDINGTITYANAAFEKIYGYAPAEVIGKNPRVIKSGLLSQENYQGFWAALLAKQSVTGEIVNKHKDGHLVYIAGTNTAIVNYAGEIIGFLAVHHDITGQKSNQDLIAKRARQQEALNLITQKIQGADTVETALQVAARELGRALGQKQTLVTLDTASRAAVRKSN